MVWAFVHAGKLNSVFFRARTLTKLEYYGGAFEPKCLPKRTDKIALVGRLQSPRRIDKKPNCNGLNTNLGSIIDLEATPLNHGGLDACHCIAQNPVQ